MSRMTVQQRNQMEGAMLADSRQRLSKGGERAVAIYLVIGLLILAALTVAAVQVFDGWHHLIVIADLVIIVIGLGFWLYPKRQHV
jgi:fatty acid desaturase